MGDANKREETSQYLLKETYYVLRYPEYDNGVYQWMPDYAGKFAALDYMFLPIPVNSIVESAPFKSLDEANEYCRKYEVFFDVLKVDVKAKPVLIPATVRHG